MSRYRRVELGCPFRGHGGIRRYGDPCRGIDGDALESARCGPADVGGGTALGEEKGEGEAQGGKYGKARHSYRHGN